MVTSKSTVHLELLSVLRGSAGLCLLSFFGSLIYAELRLGSADYEAFVILGSLAGAAFGAALAGIKHEQDWRARFFVLVATPLFALTLLMAVTTLLGFLFVSHVVVALALLVLISTLAGVGARALSTYW